MKNEMKATKGTVTINVEKTLDKIKGVCESVEKANDSYKAVMMDVYLLHKNKVHKEEKCDFYTYMNNHTGMSAMTTKGLVRVQQHIEKMCDIIANNVLVNAENISILEKTYRNFMKDCSMRQLLTMAKYEGYFSRNLIESIVSNLENEEISLSDFGEALKKEFETMYKEGLYCIEDKKIESTDNEDTSESTDNEDTSESTDNEDTSESTDNEDTSESTDNEGVSEKYLLQSESDLYQLEEVIQGLLNEGRNIIVKISY